MKREMIANKKIKSIWYWFYSSKLEIEFHSGEIMQYLKVPNEIFHSMKIADCCNEYYEKHIKWIFSWIIIEEKF